MGLGTHLSCWAQSQVNGGMGPGGCCRLGLASAPRLVPPGGCPGGVPCPAQVGLLATVDLLVGEGLVVLVGPRSDLQTQIDVAYPRWALWRGC